MQRAGQTNVVDIVSGRVSHGSVLTPTRHTPVHQFFITFLTLFWTKPQAFSHTRAKAFKKGVRGFYRVLLTEFSSY